MAGITLLGEVLLMKKGLIGFAAGLLSGVMILQGMIVLLGRTGAPGGEALIIPLIVMLFIFGWDMGKQHGAEKAFETGKDKGFYLGFEEGFYEGQHTRSARIIAAKRNESI
jgi:hypothetical protein